MAINYGIPVYRYPYKDELDIPVYPLDKMGIPVCQEEIVVGKDSNEGH